MSDGDSGKRVLSITARPTPEQKARFVAIAKSKGMSEKLAGIVIEQFLGRHDLQQNIWRRDRPKVASTDRLTIRLRPGDRCRASFGTIPPRPVGRERPPRGKPSFRWPR